MKNRYKTLRTETKQLMEQGEGQTIEFKRNEKVDAEDFIAFANSDQGGHILLGVDEIAGKDGRKKGVIHKNGVTLTDELTLKLQTKANNCVPPVPIDIFEENTSKAPLVRIDIQPSQHIPHCTQAGVYKIRCAAANAALLPNQLLDIFLSDQASEFLKRFRESTRALESSIDSISKQIDEKINEVGVATAGYNGFINVGGEKDGQSPERQPGRFALLSLEGCIRKTQNLKGTL